MIDAKTRLQPAQQKTKYLWRFYPSPDGKKYALFTYENIAFSDGIKFPSPLDIVVFQEKGNTVFKWIALENKKCLVVYRRAM